jgi:hypothetical protein
MWNIELLDRQKIADARNTDIIAVSTHVALAYEDTTIEWFTARSAMKRIAPRRWLWMLTVSLCRSGANSLVTSKRIMLTLHYIHPTTECKHPFQLFCALHTPTSVL